MFEVSKQKSKTPPHRVAFFVIFEFMLKGSLILFIIGGAYWLVIRLYAIYIMFTENSEYVKDNIKDVTLEMTFLIVPISIVMLGIALLQKTKEK
jgi:hypothetical protein